MTDGFTRATLQDHGIGPAGLQAFFDDAARLGVEFNSFMLWHDGDVVAEAWWWPYRAERVRMMHSATKSFLSAGVGLALDEGRFALQDEVVNFFPEHLPPVVGDKLAAMTVEDLLTQTCGHAHGTSGALWRGIPTSWIAEFFKIPVVFKPGEVFRYTSATSFMLSAILSKTTGGNAHDYIAPRLLRPLGIEGLCWDVGPENINPGGNGISCKTADLLKLAVLHLQGGRWNGTQVLPADWVRQATSPQRGNPHGYHWWMGPGGSFYAYGVFGQFAVVFPQDRAVLAITSATPPGEETLRSLIWHHFPGVLRARGSALQGPPGWSAPRLLAPLQRRDSPLAARVTGASYVAEANEDGILRAALKFEGDSGVFHITDARGSHTVRFGLDDWLESDTTVSGAPLHHGYEPASLRVVAAGEWTGRDVFEMTWQFVETSFRDRVVLRFEGDALTLERSVNVNSRPTLRPPVRLRRAA